MKKHLFYTFLVIFILTAIITLLGIIQVVKIKENYLTALFSALLIELVGSLIVLFRKTVFFSDNQEIAEGTILDLDKNDKNLYPILTHISKKVVEKNDEDFFLESFVCPNYDPSSHPTIHWTNIYYTWADSRGSWIRVLTPENVNPAEIHVEFFNAQNTYPSNIAIRPCGLRPLKIEPEHNYLCFEAKIPHSIDDDYLETIAMCFRFIDEIGTHWSRMRADDVYINKNLKKEENPDQWQSICIPLYDQNWRVFKGDGNYRYCFNKPHIQNMILAIIIEFGSDRRDERPGYGMGKIHFRNFHIANSKE